MKKTIKYVLLITLIAGFCLMVGGILFSVGHGKVRRVEIKTYPKELIALEEYVKKEFNLDNDAEIYNLEDVSCIEAQGKDSYKFDYDVYIFEITAPKYLKDTIALDRKIDSIGGVIKKYLPHKECHDSISINYYLFDSTTKTAFHKKDKKYKVD